jgi:hypothetical protein
MEPFFARIRVLLDTPTYIDGDTTTKPLTGFFWNIGVVAADLNEAKACLEHSVIEGAIDLANTEFIEISKVDPEIAGRYNLRPHTTCRVWYTSGRIFF